MPSKVSKWNAGSATLGDQYKCPQKTNNEHISKDLPLHTRDNDNTKMMMMVRILILAATMAEMAVAVAVAVGKCTLPLLLDFSDFMHGSSLRK